LGHHAPNTRLPGGKSTSPNCRFEASVAVQRKKPRGRRHVGYAATSANVKRCGNKLARLNCNRGEKNKNLKKMTHDKGIAAFLSARK